MSKATPVAPRENIKQHPVFTKYTRAWLNEITGYSRGYLSRVSLGKVPLSRFFISRVSSMLNQPEEVLFSPEDIHLSQCSLPCGCGEGGLGQWLKEKCRAEHLSLRQASIRVGVSHATIADIINGTHPSPETIRKLAFAFGGDGKLELDDYLLVLAGHRSKPEGEPTYLEVVPLLSPEHQRIVEVLVKEMAKVDGIEVVAIGKEGS